MRALELSSATTGRDASQKNSSALTLERMRAGTRMRSRPFGQAGVLLKAQTVPRDPKAISEACERQLCRQLRAVCSWPEEERNHGWRIGDYSFCALSFTPAPEIEPYLQFWSEPEEEGAIFEVSSGAWNPPTKRYVDAEKQELLRDHGFEIGGNADNFRKIVTIQSPAELRAVAREALAVLCKVFRYDGTVNLDYKLCLASASDIRHVMPRMSPDSFQKLLHEWGFVADVEVGQPHPTVMAVRTTYGSFTVQFLDETKRESGWFQTLILSTCCKVKSREALELATRINATMPTLKGLVNKDGNLVIESRMLLYGGVTLEHMRTRIQLWSALIEQIGKTISAAKSRATASKPIVLKNPEGLRMFFPRDWTAKQMADFFNRALKEYKAEGKAH